MSRPPDQPIKPTMDIALTSRQIHRTALILSVAATGMLLHYAALLDRHDIEQMLVPMIAMFSVIVASGLSILLHRLGNAAAASGLLVGSPLVAAPIIALSLTSSGFVLGVAATAASVQIASVNLPRRQLNRVIPVSIAIGVSTILLDLFWPGTRLAVPEDRVFVPVAASAVALVLGYSFFRQFGSYPIRTKLMTATFAIVAVAVGATIFFVNRSNSAILAGNVWRELNNTAESQALSVGQLLSRQTALLQLLSRNKTLQSKVLTSNALYPTDRANIQDQIEQFDARWAQADDSEELIQDRLNSNAASELRRFLATFPAHLQTFATDRYGALQVSTDRVDTYFHGDEAWWHAAYDDGRGAIHISPPADEDHFGLLTIKIAVPMYELDSREVIGVLRSTYGVNDLSDLLASNVTPGQRVELLLPNDTSLTAGKYSLESLPTDALPLFQTEQDQPASIEYDGEPSLVSQAAVNTLGHVPTVDALGWRVIVHQNRAESLAVIQEQERTLILIGMAVLLMTSAAAAIVSQSLTRPVIRLTAVARQVATGDLSARAAVESGDELGVLATTFNSMTTQLQETLTSLERRVAERTHALETSIEVSRVLTNILDQRQLVTEVVEQIRAAFGYYYAHIYLVDESTGELVIAAGTGPAGQAMLSRGHRIPRGKGLVGRAATTNEVVLAPDVSKDTGWLPNPLLPDTKSEIATPIAIGEHVLGVIDVQHDTVNGLTGEDARLLQSVSSQVAIALRNANLLTQAQEEAEREVMINAINLKIRDATSIEDVLQIAAQELGQALEARRACIQLSLDRQAANGRKIS